VVELDTIKPALSELSSGVTFGSQGLPIIFQARPSHAALKVASKPSKATLRKHLLCDLSSVSHTTYTPQSSLCAECDLPGPL
jgi:hypothetical protein